MNREERSEISVSNSSRLPSCSAEGSDCTKEGIFIKEHRLDPGATSMSRA